jgi:ABC-type iron transport system FetAB ATPase subunit
LAKELGQTDLKKNIYKQQLEYVQTTLDYLRDVSQSNLITPKIARGRYLESSGCEITAIGGVKAAPPFEN